mmetsp:Transcript_106898/g.309242  ORF Transcript_106898/g.309242 Transcript_106898/m.309242 type:complete len:216 (-) Transcript_106898:3121-3768(-)
MVTWEIPPDSMSTTIPRTMRATPVAIAALTRPRAVTWLCLYGKACCENREGFGLLDASGGEGPRSASPGAALGCSAGRPSTSEVSPAVGCREKFVRLALPPGWSKANAEPTRFRTAPAREHGEQGKLIFESSARIGPMGLPGCASFKDTRSKANSLRSGINSRMRNALKESTMIAKAGTANSPIQNSGSCTISISTLYIHGESHCTRQYTPKNSK